MAALEASLSGSGSRGYIGAKPDSRGRPSAPATPSAVFWAPAEVRETQLRHNPAALTVPENNPSGVPTPGAPQPWARPGADPASGCSQVEVELQRGPAILVPGPRTKVSGGGLETAPSLSDKQV